MGRLALMLAVLAGCSAPTASPQDAGMPADAGGNDAGSLDGGTPDSGGVDSGSRPLTANFVVEGDPSEGLGISDPSVFYPVGAAEGFLAYSVVPDQGHVHTRLATSTDQGATWSYVSDVNEPVPATVTTSDTTVCGQSTCTGTMIHEVASLLVDPDDTPDRQRKVFNHTYFTDGGAGLHFDIGYLSLATAPADGGTWTLVPLIGWNGSSPTSSTGVVQNATTDPLLAGLHHCLALTEPGALLRSTPGGDVIDLAVGCAFNSGGAPAIEIDLLRSTDHAQSFTFVQTLLSSSDGQALGSERPTINGADLFQVGGQTYLFASPNGAVQFPLSVGTGYRGCVAIPMADLDAGLVVRDGGVPVVVRSYLGAPLQFIGACTAAEGAPRLGVAGDVVGLQLPLFGIFFTGEPAP